MTIPTNLPPPSFPAVNEDGSFTVDWWRTMASLWTRTGGAAGVSVASVEQEAAAALALATTADAEAHAAQSTSNSALTVAAAAQATANGASTNASAALSAISSVVGNVLLKASNLGDVASVGGTRSNLGLDSFPFTFNFDTLPSGLVRSVPLVRAYTIPNNFAGSYTWANVVPTADTTFTVRYVRAGVTTSIGTITLIHSGNFSSFSSAQVSLIAGDVLQIVCPVPDATLAQLGITIRAVLA